MSGKSKIFSEKRALWASGLVLLLCAAMLVVTTFAWFTSEAASKGNKIEAGSLKVELWAKLKADGNFKDISTEEKALFSYDLWEPGFTAYKELQVRNTGTLALKYEMVLVGLEELNVADTKGIENVLFVSVNGVEVGTLADFASGTKVLYSNDLLKAGKKDDSFILEIRMDELAGNEYQEAFLPFFDIMVRATQTPFETDDYGNADYDALADYGVQVSTQAEFNDVMADIANGDTVEILLVGGEYTIPNNFAGNADTDIYITGVNGATVSQTTNMTSTKANLHFTDLTFVVLQGFVSNSSAADWTFTNCIFNASSAATPVIKRAIYIDGAVATTVSRITVTNCKFNGLTVGISYSYPKFYEDGDISGNTFTDCDHAIDFVGSYAPAGMATNLEGNNTFVGCNADVTAI